MDPRFVKNHHVISEGAVKEFAPSISITLLSHSFGNVAVRTLVGLHVDSTPADLARAFLEFVSIGTQPYTEAELNQVAGVITDIHQRHYAAIAEK